MSAHRCRDCGKPRIDPRAERCQDCTHVQQRHITREWILTSIREWAELFDAPPTATDWNLALARRTGQHWRVLRYEETERLWPSVTSARNHFGTWNAAITAAGYTPLEQYSRRETA